MAMRSVTVILAVALAGLTTTPALAAPADDARSRIRALEQRIMDADRAMPAARRSEALAARRLAAATARAGRARRALDQRAAAHRAGQAVLASRLRDLYRQGGDDPLVTALLSGGGLAELVARQSGIERTAADDAAMVARLRASRRQMARLERARTREQDAARRARDRALAARRDLQALRADHTAALRQARRALARIEARERRAEAPPPPTSRAATRATTPANGRWPAVPGGPSRAVLERIAWCESRGNPRAIGGGGQFRGKYQFMQSTWEAMGGRGDPARASEAEQDYRAAVLFVRWGPGQWPVCAAFARG